MTFSTTPREEGEKGNRAVGEKVTTVEIAGREVHKRTTRAVGKRLNPLKARGGDQGHNQRSANMP